MNFLLPWLTVLHILVIISKINVHAGVARTKESGESNKFVEIREDRGHKDKVKDITKLGEGAITQVIQGSEHVEIEDGDESSVSLPVVGGTSCGTNNLGAGVTPVKTAHASEGGHGGGHHGIAHGVTANTATGHVANVGGHGHGLNGGASGGGHGHGASGGGHGHGANSGGHGHGANGHGHHTSAENGGGSNHGHAHGSSQLITTDGEDNEPDEPDDMKTSEQQQNARDGKFIDLFFPFLDQVNHHHRPHCPYNWHWHQGYWAHGHWHQGEWVWEQSNCYRRNDFVIEEPTRKPVKKNPNKTKPNKRKGAGRQRG